MSQPSISQHIRTLEQHFNTKLFLRHGRSLELSDSGKMLVPLAQRFVKQSICIDEMMISIHGKIHGFLCLGCDALAGKYILPSLFAKFHKKYPAVTISCDTSFPLSPLEALIEGTIHFAVTSAVEKRVKGIEAHKILTEEFFLFTAQDHPWAGQNRISPEQLLTEKFILPTKNSETHQLLQAQLLDIDIDIQELNTFLHLGTPEAILLSVQKGLGVSFMSRQIATMVDGIAKISVDGLSIRRDNHIVRNTHQASTSAREAFWHFIKDTKISDFS